jgi:hypothetical protein
MHSDEGLERSGRLRCPVGAACSVFEKWHSIGKLERQRGQLTMAWDLLVDALLVAGFGIQHSVLATVGFKARLNRKTGINALLWRAFQSFFNVGYVLGAVLAWRSVNVVVWDLSGIAAVIVISACALSWLWYFQLHIFEYDAGLAFGSSAAISAALRRRSPGPELWTAGTRRWIRFPVHTAFFPMFLAFPRMTLSTLVFGITANVYNIIGTILYDKRLERMGEPYITYQRLTGNFLPRSNVLRGAADLKLPERRHWARPMRYAAALVVAVSGGVAYYVMLGAPARSASGAIDAAGVALLLALAGGTLLGLAPKGRLHLSPDGLDYRDLQACVSAAAAIVSAMALATWFTLSYLVDGTVPFLGFVLPMWIIVLWVGHVCLYMIGFGDSSRRASELAAATASGG